MSTNVFTQNETIVPIITKAKRFKTDGKQFSDIVDAKGNQYVDLVQEGGGVLGIALVGYTYVLETAGIRFFSLAGTSAGAINTMMMAGLGKIEEAKSEKILKVLSNKDLFDLVDGDKAIKKLINKAIKKEKGLGWALAWRGIKIYKILKRKLGLNPGSNFEQWITKELEHAKIFSLKNLMDLRKVLPDGLKERNSDTPINDISARLAIITSDITTHTKTEFPRMAELYWQEVDKVPPAKLVRASMSIPFFFEPFEIANLPNAGNVEDPKWDEYAKYSGPVPEKAKFVDGGMLSNFPINVFHRADGGVPRMPTFGARLSAYRDDFSKADSLLGISGAMISTMRQIHDYDFLLKNPDYSQLICRIDADQNFNWLDFNMTREQQVALFNLGAQKAIEFLEGFDWEGYKTIRNQQNRTL